MTEASSFGQAGKRVFGVCTLAFGLGYEVTQIIELLGGFPKPWGHFAIVLPSLLLAGSWLGFLTLIHETASLARRPWTRLALSFATIYATLNSFVYIIQLTVVVPEALAGGPGFDNAFAMVGGKALTAVNAVAYALLSLSAAFLGLAAQGRFARVALLAHGALAPLILAILYVPALMPAGGLWLFTFPFSTGALLAEECGRRQGYTKSSRQA